MFFKSNFQFFKLFVSIQKTTSIFLYCILKNIEITKIKLKKTNMFEKLKAIIHQLLHSKPHLDIINLKRKIVKFLFAFVLIL